MLVDYRTFAVSYLSKAVQVAAWAVFLFYLAPMGAGCVLAACRGCFCIRVQSGF